MKKEQRITTVLLTIYLIILTWIILLKMQVTTEMLPSIRNINLIPYGQSVIVNGRIDTAQVPLYVSLL